MEHYAIGTEELTEHLVDDTVSIGSVLVGARITAGKSLDDVFNELRIPVATLEAFEADDLSGLATKPYLMGYIRSYAKYLDIDPDALFQFYQRRNLIPAAQNLKSNAASFGKSLVVKSTTTSPLQKTGKTRAQSGFYPNKSKPSFDFSSGFVAIGYVVPVALVAGVIGVGGFGAYSVLGGFQGLEVVPADIEPQVTQSIEVADAADAPIVQVDSAIPAIDYDQLYERQALQTPVVEPRVGRIADLIQPNANLVNTANGNAENGRGALGASIANPTLTSTEIAGNASPVVSVGPSKPEIELLPMDEAWVSISDEDGNVIKETLLKPGQTLPVSFDGIIPVLRRAGNANLLFVRVNGTVFGPIGIDGETVVSNVALTPQALDTVYDPVGEEVLAPLSEVESAYLAKLEPADVNNQ